MTENQGWPIQVVLPSDEFRLAEARFWIRIFKEHSLFIKLGLPCDRADLIATAESFYQRLSAIETELQSVSAIAPALAQAIVVTASELIEFKRGILRKLIACTLKGSALYPLLIDHITREAVRFLDRFLNPPPVDPLFYLLTTEEFWMRIMKEHIEFVIHLLDPSEKTLLAQSGVFLTTFEELLAQARDFLSMSMSRPPAFNTVARYTETVLEQTKALRDFKAAAYELDVLCRLLSIIPSPLLLDHVRREAGKALEDISSLKNMIPGM